MSPVRIGHKQVTTYFPDDLHEQIRTKAFLERTSINKLVLRAVEEMLAKSPPGEITVKPKRGRRKT